MKEVILVEMNATSIMFYTIWLIVFILFMYMLFGNTSINSSPCCQGMYLEKRKDRVCLVTGGTRGIGFSVCEKLLHRGDRVILIGRSKIQVDSILDKLKWTYHDKIEVYNLDLKDLDEIPRLIKMILKHHGRIDVLINNAAVGSKNKTSSVDYVERINAKAPKIFIDYVLPSMKRNNYGRIINVTSTSAVMYPSKPYGHSKYLLNKLTREYTYESLEGHDIQINAVCVLARTSLNPRSAYSPIYAAEDIVNLTLLPKDGPTGEVLNGTYMTAASHKDIKNWSIRSNGGRRFFTWV